jgi:hypothetical protein
LLVGGRRSRIDRSEIELLNRPRSTEGCRVNRRRRRFVELWDCTKVSQIKTLNMFYLVIYWTQKVHNDFIFLCSIILPPVGHSSNHEYHCWNLQENRAVFRNFIALLRFSFDSPSYKARISRIIQQILTTFLF